jgi:protein SCO1
MKASHKKALVLVLILLAPGLFYLALKSARHNVQMLETFGPKVPCADGDTIYHTIPGFEFINQYGKKISRKDFEGKIFVADFIFTTCQTICPKMSGQMTWVQEKVKDMDDVLLLSHTVDPENDSVPVLYDYATKMGARENKWHLVTGGKKELYDIARKGYLVTAMEGDGGPDDFIHSEKFLLIDKQGKIRGFYDGTDPKEMKRLVDEIKVLKYEEQVPKKKKNKL